MKDWNSIDEVLLEDLEFSGNSNTAGCYNQEWKSATEQVTQVEIDYIRKQISQC